MSGLPIALLAFAAGATLLQWHATLPPFAPALVAAGVLAGVAVVLRRFDPPLRVVHPVTHRLAVFARGAMVAAAASVLGFGYAAWRAESRLADQLPPQWEGVDIAVVGIVDELPQSSSRGTRFAFAVERVETAGGNRAGPPVARVVRAAQEGRRPAKCRRRWPQASAGGLTVRLKRPHGTVNPHGFDIEAWLLENNLRATGYVRKDERNARLDAFAGRPSDWVERARERVRARILAALPEAGYAGVIVALAIGDQRAIPEAQWRIFSRTGITHLISISGLHVTVFAALAGGARVRRSRAAARGSPTRMPARKLAAAGRRRSRRRRTCCSPVRRCPRSARC